MFKNIEVQRQAYAKQLLKYMYIVKSILFWFIIFSCNNNVFIYQPIIN